VISQRTENVNRSTPPRREQISAVNNPGSISVRLSTRYTVVHRSEASLSTAVFGWTKCVTSAICTPTLKFPLANGSQETASSMSLHPGGSTEHTHIFLKSLRPSRSFALGVQLAGGRQRSTASLNSRVMTPCSCKMTALSTSRLLASPRIRVQCPRGLLLCLSQPSRTTVIRLFSKLQVCRV